MLACNLLERLTVSSENRSMRETYGFTLILSLVDSTLELSILLIEITVFLFLKGIRVGKYPMLF